MTGSLAPSHERMSSMSETPASPRVDAAVGRYLSQTLLSREAHNQDGQYHLQVQWLRETLASADQAMVAEGIPSDVRDRVIHRVLYGSLDERAAIGRIAAHQAAVEQVKVAPWSGPVTGGLTPGRERMNP